VRTPILCAAALLGACAAAGSPKDVPDDVRQALQAYEEGLRAAAAGDDRQAVDHFTRALAFDGRFPQAYAARAQALARLDREDEALADFGRAIEAAGSRPGKWYYYRARFHHERGRLDQAERDYDAAVAALRRVPDNSFLDVYLHRALLYADTGRPQRAIADYEAALALDPDAETAAAIRRWMERVRSGGVSASAASAGTAPR
jgi:tetratricopeptide (TPR) repeat protein